MRIIVLLFALIGGLACAVCGVALKSMLPSSEGQPSLALLEMMIRVGVVDPLGWLERLLYLSHALLAAFPLAVLGGMLGLLGRGKWAAGVLLFGAAGPLVLLAWRTPLPLEPVLGLAASAGLLAAGGLLCFFLPPLPDREAVEEAEPLRTAALEPASSAITANPDAASPVEEVLDEVDEIPMPRTPKRHPHPQGSPAAILVAFLLFVGSAAAFSVLAAMNVIHPGRASRPDRAGKDLVEDGDGGDHDPFGNPEQQDVRPELAPDQGPDPKELARLAAARQAKLEKLQATEKQLLDRLRAAAPARGADLALWRLKAEQIPIHHLVFAPDGATLATAADKTIQLWDVGSGKVRHTLTGHTGEVRGLAFAPDGRLLASASRDKSLRLWDVATGETRFGFTLEDAEFGCVTFSPDGKLVLGGTVSNQEAGQIKAWEVDSARFSGIKGEEFPHVQVLAYSPDGHNLLASSGLTDVALYDAHTFKRLRVIRFDGMALDMALQPDGQALAIPSGSGEQATVKLWNPRTGAVQRTFPDTAAEVGRLSFSPDGKLLASKVGGGLKEAIQLWDVASGKRLPTRTGPPDGEVHALAFSPGGTFLAASVGGEVKLWAVADLLRTAPRDK